MSFLHFLSSLQTPILLSHTLIQIHGVFITYMYTHTYSCIFMPKYNVLSVYDVTYMYDFRANHMVSIW